MESNHPSNNVLSSLGLQRTAERHALFHQFCVEDIIETCAYNIQFKEVVTDIYNQISEPKQQNFIFYVRNKDTTLTQRFWEIIEEVGKQAIYDNLNIFLNNGQRKHRQKSTPNVSTESINSLQWQFSSDNLYEGFDPFESYVENENVLENKPIN